MTAPYVQHRGDGYKRKYPRLYCTCVQYSSQYLQCGERTHRKKGRRAAWAAACLGRPFPAVQRGALGGCGRGGSTKKPFEFPIRNSYTSSALPCYSSYESFLVHNVWLTLMLR